MPLTPQEKEALLIALDTTYGRVTSAWESNDSGLTDAELEALREKLS